jgi:hypothetical protein
MPMSKNGRKIADASGAIRIGFAAITVTAAAILAAPVLAEPLSKRA